MKKFAEQGRIRFGRPGKIHSALWWSGFGMYYLAICDDNAGASFKPFIQYRLVSNHFTEAGAWDIHILACNCARGM